MSNKKERYFLLKYCNEGGPIKNNGGKYKIKPELADKDNEKFKDYENKGLFTENDSRIIIEDDEHKKEIIDEFEKISTNDKYQFYLMRNSFYKILLYEYCLKDNNDEGIKKIKEDVFLNNYFFINKIKELFENDNLDSRIKEKFYDLVYDTFIDKRFNISDMKYKFDPSEVINKNISSLFEQFINILIGKYDANKKFIPNDIFKNYKQDKWETLFEHIAKVFINVKDIPKDKAIYLLSLENNIPFIEKIINHNNYTHEYNKLKEQFIIDNVKVEVDDDIMKDLFAKSFFMKEDKNNKYKYFRYPIWLIIKLYYTKKDTKSICEDYFDKVENNIISRDKTKKHERSLLHERVCLLGEHVNDEIKKYFELKTKPKMIIFKSDKNTFDSLLDQLQGIEEENTIQKAKEFSDLIPTLIKQKMESHFSKKDFFNDINTNEDMLNKLQETITNECKSIITSLNNKEILKHGNKIEQIIKNDIFKNKTLTIDNVEELLPNKLIQLINKPKITEKHFPTFLNEIDVDIDLILRTFQLKESFLNDDSMKEFIKTIIEQNKEEKNIQSLIKINKYVNEHIIELYLLYKINCCASKINSQNKQNNLYNIGEKNTDNIFQKELDNILINISYEEKKINDFKELMKYSKELCKRIKYTSENLFNLELQCIATENKDLMEKKDTLKIFTNSIIHENKIDESIFKDKSTVLFKKEKKYILDLLRIYYFKNNSKQNTNNTEIKNIINILCSNIELSMEGCSLYQQIIGDLIPINMNEDLTISNNKEGKKFFEIKDNAVDILEKLLNFVKNINNPKYQKVIPKISTSIYMLIQSIERHLLKIISKRNAQILDEEDVTIPYFNTAMEFIKTCNEHMNKEGSLVKEDKEELLKQFIAVAFLKVYFQAYFEILDKKEENTSYCHWASNQLSANSENYQEVIKIIEFYVLKLIRNKKCESFREFRNFNFNEIQMLWVSDLKFKGKFDTEFEYLFISEWEDSKKNENGEFNQLNTSNFFNKYDCFLKEYFDLLRKELFRTTQYDSKIKELIEKDNVEMYVDVIMNEILCNTWNEEYTEKMEYVEFSSWSKHLINLLEFQNRELKNYLSLLSVYSDTNIDYRYSKILKSLKKQNNTISFIDLEIVLISLKFVLVFILKTNNLNEISKLKENVDGIDNDNYKELLSKKLINFLSLSVQFSIDLKTEEAQCEDLLIEYKEIRRLLRLNNINQIKLFMNFLYYRIKTNISNNGDNLNNIIDNAITDWPSQKPFIQKYYEYVLYKEERIRNLLLEERMTPEATDLSKCDIKDINNNPLKIPIFSLFYYEELPTWDHFTKTNESYIKKHTDEYPFINFFLDPNKYDYYGKDLSDKEIKEILNYNNYKSKNIYPFKYSGFISLDDLVSYYSKSYVFAPKEEPNFNLGDLIEYDIDAIENELSSIKYFIVEK